MKLQLPFINYAVRNQSSTSLDIAIDGEIVDAETQQMYARWFDDDTSVSFKSFRDSINKAISEGVTVINGTINCPGGQVTESMAIHDFIVELQEEKGITVNMVGRGIVASAATYILMASKNSSLSANSWFMIHNVSGFAYGDVNQVENQAKTLRKFNDQIAKFYSNATGLSETVIGNMMDKETWLTADEAKDKGFVKNVSASATFTNSITPDKWLFKNTSVLAAYNSFTQNSETVMVNKIVEGIKNALQELGIIAKEGAQNTAIQPITNEALTAALTEALKPVSEDITNMVNTAVDTKLTDIQNEVATQVTNTVKETFKGFVTAENFKKLNDELEEVKKSVANRTAGGAKPRNEKPAPADDPTDHEGITWGEQE